MPIKLGIKFKLTLKGSRAADDGETIIGAMIDSWSVLQEHLATLDD